MEPQCEERHWMTINVQMLFVAIKQPSDLQTNNYLKRLRGSAGN